MTDPLTRSDVEALIEEAQNMARTFFNGWQSSQTYGSKAVCFPPEEVWDVSRSLTHLTQALRTLTAPWTDDEVEAGQIAHSKSEGFLIAKRGVRAALNAAMKRRLADG